MRPSTPKTVSWLAELIKFVRNSLIFRPVSGTRLVEMVSWSDSRSSLKAGKAANDASNMARAGITASAVEKLRAAAARVIRASVIHLKRNGARFSGRVKAPATRALAFANRGFLGTVSGTSGT